ncbi:phosphoribosyltransferase [Cupriavidus consociatus]|uniref:phosphoribosyltransferase n=1 Tax=Cupriavidus consociatus TaxID=2821357 RepID=UPI001AE49547|nr:MULTISPECIES: phosphoribosyltransferase family protein [unclassified Cupriavidus]MBP0618560.1 phosphoribosyltransferase [Cupriavidus sp. LEh25]MDK2655196.1 phosphoribosyltransferase family protein [Cupriavidus sp. LEh21]
MPATVRAIQLEEITRPLRPGCYPTKFHSREHAGAELAKLLSTYRVPGVLVLAIPRGGVPVGRVVADALEADFDVVMARRVAAGVAVDDTGTAWTSGAPSVIDEHAAQCRAQTDALCRQRALYAGVRQFADPRGRTVIVVDDGLVSGATMIAALASVRKRQPAPLICALPVANRVALEEVRALADEVICLATPERVGCLAHWYREFQLLTDDKVRQLIEKASPTSSRHAADRSIARLPALSMALRIPYAISGLPAMLESPPNPQAVVLMAYAGNAQRRNPRSQYLARKLRGNGFATMLVNLQPGDRSRDAQAFDIDDLEARIKASLAFLDTRTPYATLPVGLFAAGIAAAAALRADVSAPGRVGAIACVAGRPDLAGAAILHKLSTPLLLMYASGDADSQRVNTEALTQVDCIRQLQRIQTNGRGFDDRKALERIATLTADWLGPRTSSGQRRTD